MTSKTISFREYMHKTVSKDRVEFQLFHRLTVLSWKHPVMFYKHLKNNFLTYVRIQGKNKLLREMLRYEKNNRHSFKKQQECLWLWGVNNTQTAKVLKSLRLLFMYAIHAKSRSLYASVCKLKTMKSTKGTFGQTLWLHEMCVVPGITVYSRWKCLSV